MHSLQSLSVGNGDENEKSEKETVKLKRSLYFFCRNDEELFAELDRKLAIPLIPEFKDYFISELKNRELLSPLRVCCIGRKFEGWHMNVSSEENEIAAVLEDGLKSGRIAIPGADPNAEDVFSDIRSFTQYLKQFSGKIADRIKKCFPPVYHPGEQPVSDKLREVNQYVRESHRLFAVRRPAWRRGGAAPAAGTKQTGSPCGGMRYWKNQDRQRGSVCVPAQQPEAPDKPKSV